MSFQEEYISPSKLKWSKLKQDEIKGFKTLYKEIFSIDIKNISIEDIIEGLDSKYYIMTIKNIDKLIGFAIYRIINSDELEILRWFGPICSEHHQKFLPPGFQGNRIKKTNIKFETIGICNLCQSWTC